MRASQDDGGVALRLMDVRKQLGATEIIRGVSLSVRKGERLALIGPNGAGKSTLFNLISGLMRPDQGAIYLHDRRIDGCSVPQISRQGVARSFQVSSVFDQLTVFDNLRCGLFGAEGVAYTFWRGLSRLHQGHHQVGHMLDALNLTHRSDALAAHLSYAERRALELGMTVIGGAELILLDEPTAGMSPMDTQHTVELIRRLTQGKTLVLVEHDMTVVFDLADRLAVLNDGQLLALGGVDEVRADPRVQAAYLGTHGGGLTDGES